MWNSLPDSIVNGFKSSYDKLTITLLIVKPGGGTVIFRYYLLGGDTAAPSGLNARLCHAFLVSFFFYF